MKCTITTFIFLIWAMIGFAQTTPTFLGSSSYPVTSLCNNGNKEEYAEFVLSTSDEGFLLVGSYQCNGNDWDGRVIKTDANGNMLWYDLPGYAGFDVLRSAVEVSDGYVVAGEVEVSGRAYIWLIKYNLAGTQILWEQQVPNANQNLSVTAYTIISDFQNNLMVGGARWSTGVTPPYGSAPNAEGRVWVFNPNGIVINTGVSTAGYAALKIEKSSDNTSYYVFGEKYYATQQDCWFGGGGPTWTVYDSPYFPSNNGTYGINYNAYYSDVVVDKFNSSLSLLWTQNYGGNTPDGFIDGIATPDGGFALLGDTYCQSQFGQTGPNNVAANYPTNRYWLLKGNSSGIISWVKPVGGHPNIDAYFIPRGLSNTCDAKYLVLLDQYLFSTTPYGIRLEKHDANSIIWTAIQTMTDGYTTDVKRTSDNKFVVVGNRYNQNAGNYDFKICRWSADPNCANACTNATPLTCGLAVSGNTTTGTNSFGASNFTICSGFTTTSTFNANDKIYSINKTSSAGDLVVTLFSSVDHDIFLFNQCNGIPSGCVGRSTLPATNGLNQEVIRIPNAPSGIYYIVVDGYNTAQQGPFTLTVTCGNLSCSGATPISCGQTLNNQSNASASNNVSTYCNQSLPGPGTGCTGKERVYSISVTQQQPVTINLTGIDANEDFELFLLNGCNKDVCIGSSTNAWGVQEQIVANLSPGVQYYIVVDGWWETQGNYNLSVNCCPTPTYSFNCGNIVYVQAGTSNPLQYTFSSVGQNIATGFTWQVNNQNVTNATGNSFTHTFPSAGTYEVCFPVIGANGCVEYCCRKYCIAPPVNCETSLLYSFNGSQMVFNLQTGGQTSSASWAWDDKPGVEIGTGNQISVPIPPQCTTRTISVKYIDVTTGCWRICCRTIYICNPFNCYNFTYSYNGNNGFVFTMDPSLSGATNITWTVDDHPGGALNIGNAVTSQPYPVPSPCVNRTITLRYFYNGVWYICCRTINLCNPFNCYNFTYSYNGNNGFVFTMDPSLSGATNISWMVDDHPGGALNIGSTVTSQPYPVPSPCVNRTITLRYFYNGVWYICCRTINLCNPFNCYNFTYSYNGNNGFVFTMDPSLSGATNVSWTVDDHPGGALNIGSAVTSQPYPVPSPCVNRTITLRYFFNGVWYICCRTILLCNPFDCGSITLNYVANQGYTFTLAQATGLQNISWQVDQTGQSLGDNISTSQPLPVPAPGNCVLRTVSVRYFDPVTNCWRICCLTFWLCNPNDCSTTISPTYGQNGSTTLQVNANYQQVQWFNGTTAIGNPNTNPLTTTFQPGSSPTVYVRYYDPGSGCYYYCCRTLTIPPPCIPTASFTASISGSTATFTNTSTGNPTACSWTINGATVSSSCSNLTQTLLPGNHQCCLTVSNACGTSQQFCQTINISCTLPTASFNASVSGTTASFTNTSTANPTACTWTINGATVSSSCSNLTQTLLPGNHQCCLTVSNACGTSQAFCQTVTVTMTTPQGWDFVPTSENHTIIVPANLVGNVNGQPLAVGDLIGFFYSHNNSQFCAGYGTWTGVGSTFPVYGNDAISPNKNGFAQGEIFKVKVWRSAQQAAVDVQATYSPPNGNPITHTNAFANDGISQLQGLTGSSTLDIPLTAGWNIISSYVTPASPNMVDVFSSIQSKVVIVKDGAGNAYFPSIGVNNIGNWTTIKGYQVKVTENTTLSIAGQKVDPTATPIPLATGWQTIAYLRDSQSPPATQFGSIASSIIQVKNSLGQSYLPSLPPPGGSLTSLVPTQGYKVKASSPATLTYTANLVPGDPIDERANGQPLRFFRLDGLNTGDNATIIIPSGAMENVMEPGDEIGFFTQDGILCGAAAYTGQVLVVTIWGDDLTTPNRKEGLSAGESFYAKIWRLNGLEESIYQLAMAEGEPNYLSDGIFTLRKLLENNAGEQHLPQIFVQPNPASDKVKLVFHHVHSSDLLLTLYSQDGGWRKEIFNGEFSGEIVEKEFSVADLPAGMYFCSARFNDQVLTYRIVVQH
jgi:PKD repeat protein